MKPKFHSLFVNHLPRYNIPHIEIKGFKRFLPLKVISAVWFIVVKLFFKLGSFFKKATSSIWYYNLVRKNGNRGYKSPLAILRETGERINPLALMLPGLYLDDLLDQKLRSGGHHVPELSFLYQFFP